MASEGDKRTSYLKSKNVSAGIFGGLLIYALQLKLKERVVVLEEALAISRASASHFDQMEKFWRQDLGYGYCGLASFSSIESESEQA